MKKRKSKTYSLTWSGRMLAIRHTRDYLVRGQDHIEVFVRKPVKAMLPITETGYRSYFIDGEELATHGGPVLFVQAWLEREAATKEWRDKLAKLAQLELFRR
jgi:hypothetical protein